MSKRLLFAAALVAVLAAAGLGTYFVSDGRAREGKGARKGPAAVPVNVAAVQQQTVPVRLTAIGNVEAYATVSIKARVDGQIVEVNFREGEEVKKGAVLFRIDPRPFEATLRQAEANALRDTAARDQARSQEKRYQELLDKNFISKEAYAQIRTNAETAEAVAQASQAALENARLQPRVLHHPLADRRLRRQGPAADGQPGEGERHQLRWWSSTRCRPIYVNFAVPEQSLPEVRKYMAGGPLGVEVVPPDSDKRRASAGTLIFVDNAVDPTTGTIKLRAQFANEEAALWPGQFVNVSLRLYEQEDAIVIPVARRCRPARRASTSTSSGPTCSPKMRKVTVQRADGERAIIANGLAEGRAGGDARPAAPRAEDARYRSPSPPPEAS